MKPRLMHPDRDWDARAPGPWNERDLAKDLSLDGVLSAMAAGDPFLLAIARATLFGATSNDGATIIYRQRVLRDCLDNPATVRKLYSLAVEGMVGPRTGYFGILGRTPGVVLYGASDRMRLFVTVLRELRLVADEHGGAFESRAFGALFEMLQREFSDGYLAEIERHLARLKFKGGVLMSARLGEGNGGKDYLVRLPGDNGPSWLGRLLGAGTPRYSFRIADRDEAGARALSELRDRALNEVADAIAQAADRVGGFFERLRTELAFYVGCLNLHEALASVGAETCLPLPAPVNKRTLHFAGLSDVSLALAMRRRITSNTVDADGKCLVMITGANQGGKSAFLRSIGLAQLMMQCGMFVAAESFASSTCSGLFTHFTREEDATMRLGKLDEELSRMSEIADHIAPNGMLLLNESFASTNEREGSEIARQVVDALLEPGVRILFVSHLYEFAHGLFALGRDGDLFLRAERLPDGTRTFRITPAEPLQTSYGPDLYRLIFPEEAADRAP